MLYPNQLALGTTPEYFAIPQTAYAEISPRSSYSRLGLSVGGIMQPGFRGCVPLELLNHEKNVLWSSPSVRASAKFGCLRWKTQRAITISLSRESTTARCDRRSPKPRETAS